MCQGGYAPVGSVCELYARCVCEVLWSRVGSMWDASRLASPALRVARFQHHGQHPSRGSQPARTLTELLPAMSEVSLHLTTGEAQGHTNLGQGWTKAWGFNSSALSPSLGGEYSLNQWLEF